MNEQLQIEELLQEAKSYEQRENVKLLAEKIFYIYSNYETIKKSKLECYELAYQKLIGRIYA